MERSLALGLAVLTVVAAIAAPAAALGAGEPPVAIGDEHEDGETEHEGGETEHEDGDMNPPTAADDVDTEPLNAETPPGERLAGTVGVQGAGIDGEIDSRSFALSVAGAQTDDEAADVVQRKVTANRERLAAIERRTAELEQLRDNGTITDGRYRAELATLSVQAGTIERTTERSVVIAEGLPADVVEERGVDVVAIEELRSNATTLRRGTADRAGDIAGDRPERPSGSTEGPVPGSAVPVDAEPVETDD